MPVEIRREVYESQRTSLATDRAPWEPAWKDCDTYLRPGGTRFDSSDQNRGPRLDKKVLDASPQFAAGILESGMHAGVTSPARPFFRITTPDPDLAERPDVKQWLYIVQERLHTFFLRSNLYTALPTLYGDLGVFGTGAFALLEDGHDVMRAYHYPVGSYYLGMDERNVATTFVLDYRRTVRQLVQEFGPVNGDRRTIDWSRFSTFVKKCWDDSKYEQPVDVSWIMTPNDEYDPRRVESKYGMAWRSCHFERGRQKGDFQQGSEESGAGALRDSGYRQFPILAPRWRVIGGDSYGVLCPGFTALGDTKGLQYMQRKVARAIDKWIDPPMQAGPGMQNSKVSLIAGDVTYALDGVDGGVKPIHEVRGEGIQALVAHLEQAQGRVNEAFFVPLFMMIARAEGTQPLTAEEVRARNEEKMLVLGPTLERLNDELLDPLIDRGFDIMLSWGAIPPAPPDLQGIQLKIEYISIMQAAQKLAGAVGQDRFVSSVLTMAQGGLPQVLYKLNPFHLVDRYADTFGADPRSVVPDEDAAAALQAAQAAQQAQQRAEQMKTIGEAARAAAAAPIEGGQRTALDAMGEAAA